jgi:hypothetical protein
MFRTLSKNNRVQAIGAEEADAPVIARVGELRPQPAPLALARPVRVDARGHTGHHG